MRRTATPPAPDPITDDAPEGAPDGAADGGPADDGRDRRRRPRRRPGLVSRTIYRVLARFHGWAESGWGGPAVGGWGVLQGSVMPGPSDTVLVPLGLADPARVWRLALWATAGATLGGLLAYLLGLGGGERLALPLLERLGVSAGLVDRAEAALAARGWLVVALSTFTPISTKVVCLAAGTFGVPVWQFLPALLVGRALRFFAIAAVLRYAGPGVLDVIARRAGVRPVTWTTEGGRVRQGAEPW